jgi:hypothetical protein
MKKNCFTTLTAGRLSATEGCGVTKGCFGSENECVMKGNCKLMTSFKHLPDQKSFLMTMAGSGIGNNQYVAVGLSADASMGDDLVSML